MPKPYQLIRSHRKTLALQVKEAELIVRAPMRMAEKDIQGFINSKSAWIKAKINEQKQKLAEKTTLQCGSQLLFLGQSYQIKQIDGPPALYFDQQQLTIASHKPAQIKRLIEQWLRAEAETHILERCQHWASTMQFSGLIKDIRFRKTRSKWGHCTIDGRLQFNWLLIMAPTAVIDYVVVHELCHLRHMNHSKDFWQLVEQFCPTFQLQKQWLKQNGHKLAIE